MPPGLGIAKAMDYRENVEKKLNEYSKTCVMPFIDALLKTENLNDVVVNTTPVINYLLRENDFIINKSATFYDEDVGRSFNFYHAVPQAIISAAKNYTLTSESAKIAIDKWDSISCHQNGYWMTLVGSAFDLNRISNEERISMSEVDSILDVLMLRQVLPQNILFPYKSAVMELEKRRDNLPIFFGPEKVKQYDADCAEQCRSLRKLVREVAVNYHTAYLKKNKGEHDAKN